MRITGGHLLGRKIPSPGGQEIRPTSARVREALFSMAGQSLTGWTVLDAFGGSGILGMEAASRGGNVTTVEQDHKAARAIEAVATKIGLELKVCCADAAKVLATGSWDLVLLDPPYVEDPVMWAQRAQGSVDRLLVVEHRQGANFPTDMGMLRLDRQRTYGDTMLTFYRMVE